MPAAGAIRVGGSPVYAEMAERPAAARPGARHSGQSRSNGRRGGCGVVEVARVAHRFLEALCEQTIAILHGDALALEDLLGARAVVLEALHQGVERLAAGRAEVACLWWRISPVAASITRSAEHSGQTTRRLFISAIESTSIETGLRPPARSPSSDITPSAPRWAFVRTLGPVIEPAARILRQRQLLAVMTARELKARYRGSVLGFLWSLVNPLLLLGVYTFVFSLVFQPRTRRPVALPGVPGRRHLPLGVGDVVAQRGHHLAHRQRGADPPLGLPGRAPAAGRGAVEPGQLPALGADRGRRAARRARSRLPGGRTLDRALAAGGGAASAVSLRRGARSRRARGPLQGRARPGRQPAHAGVLPDADPLLDRRGAAGEPARAHRVEPGDAVRARLPGRAVLRPRARAHGLGWGWRWRRWWRGDSAPGCSGA